MRALLFLIAAVLLLGSASGFAPTAKGSFSRNIFKMQESLGFNNQESYINYLKANSALPAGFLVGASRFNFKPMEVDKTLPMNLTIIMTEKPTTSFAAMFTSNEFCGGPIIVGRERMKSSKQLQAIVVNNKISNVCPGGVSDRGAGDSESICEEVAKYLKLESKNLVFPSSTGIIGWRLPVKSMLENGVPGAVNSLQKQSILPAALGITTTDRYPKVRSYKSPKGWSVVGTAKGAGMIGECMSI
jgi:glutamate N-acetyltransferase/amino-acid N-acetyltransferase